MSDSPDQESDSDWIPSSERASETPGNKHRASLNPQDCRNKRQKLRDDRVRTPVSILPAPSAMAPWTPHPNANQPYSAVRSRPRTVLNAKR